MSSSKVDLGASDGDFQSSVLSARSVAYKKHGGVASLSVTCGCMSKNMSMILSPIVKSTKAGIKNF